MPTFLSPPNHNAVRSNRKSRTPDACISTRTLAQAHSTQHKHYYNSTKKEHNTSTCRTNIFVLLVLVLIVMSSDDALLKAQV